ncbi:LLM class flavin-dependent oxidoreductase [Streptomyces sp. HPF1205]|uniref:LLM class flavin-dependent oxidoreductase n=1 Tax=Streptomyces sp. HPF1205 TaxID=2873262 RepID=UPI001CED1E1C|nr:LLM class flavin-dependent oxidoreductase [Streptomyces sp. HPF1205]
MPGRVSFMFPQQPTDPDAIVPFGRLVQETGAARLWLGQSLRIESHPAIAYLAGTGCRISVGMAVGLMVLRHPYDAALQARSLAALMREPVAIGYGAAYPSFVRGVRGEPYARPAAAVGEFVDIARRLANNQAVSHDGEMFSVHTRLPPMSTAAVEIGAGVLRPGMARTAGRTCDLAMTWLTPLNYLTDVIMPAVAEGARGVQRPPRIVCVVHAGVRRPGRNPMLLAQYGSISHLQAPHYTDMLRKAGLDVDASDPVSGARELVQAGVYLYGSPEHIAREIGRYHAVGVDEVVINPSSVSNMYGLRAAAEDLTEVFAALREQGRLATPEGTGGGAPDPAAGAAAVGTTAVGAAAVGAGLPR